MTAEDAPRSPRRLVALMLFSVVAAGALALASPSFAPVELVIGAAAAASVALWGILSGWADV